ncbi:MAG: formylmethanofuran dehydrogenase subunit E family protein [Candidatus Omnitrophota bacterium]
MRNKKITLKEGVRFHGHLGPYLVLGIRAGEWALRRLKCKKYFGMNVKVWGVHKKPKSCLVDGLQLSTGATLGKGNIEKCNGSRIKMEFTDILKKKRVWLELKEDLVKRLREAKTHRDCESLAKGLYRAKTAGLFIGINH